MRRRAESQVGETSDWGAAKLLVIAAVSALVALALLAGVVLAVAAAIRDDEPAGPVTSVEESGPPSVSRQDALAAAPMPAADPDDALPGPLSTRAPGVIELPRPASTGRADVPSGFPRTPEGALAQLAAIDTTAMETGSVDGARRVIDAWAAPGGPTGETWSGVHGMASLLSAAGLSSAGSPQLAIVVRPVMGLVKGTVGPDFAVVCVDYEFTVTLEQTARAAVANCQRMQWSGDRWLIGAGSEPAPGPSIWPGTDAAIAAGYRDLRHV